MSNKERLIMWAKGALAMLIMFCYAIGLIGGAGNLFYYKEYVPAICVIVCCILAFPKVKEYFEKFIKD